MAGYLAVEGTYLNLGHLRTLLTKAEKANVPDSKQLQVGFMEGQLIIAVQVDIVKRPLPPVPAKKAAQPMKRAARRKR